MSGTRKVGEFIRIKREPKLKDSKDKDVETRLAELIKQLEARNVKVTDMTGKIKSIGFVQGIGSHQKPKQ